MSLYDARACWHIAEIHQADSRRWATAVSPGPISRKQDRQIAWRCLRMAIYWFLRGWVELVSGESQLIWLHRLLNPSYYRGRS